MKAHLTKPQNKELWCGISFFSTIKSEFVHALFFGLVSTCEHSSWMLSTPENTKLWLYEEQDESAFPPLSSKLNKMIERMIWFLTGGFTTVNGICTLMSACKNTMDECSQNRGEVSPHSSITFTHNSQRSKIFLHCKKKWLCSNGCSLLIFSISATWIVSQSEFCPFRPVKSAMLRRVACCSNSRVQFKSKTLR